MLRIERATYDAIVAHAKRDHPDEACGVVAGPAGSDRPERFIEMVNAAGSPTFYEFDSTELLALYRLDGHAGEYAGVLSGGQRKLLDFARVLMAEPRLVLLDEPMAGVNPALG